MASRAGSNRIGDLESATKLDDKDEFLFFQNSTKKTKKVTRRNMLLSPGVTDTLGITNGDSTPPSIPTGLTVTTATEKDRDGTEKVYIKASINANSETDLASYGWSIRRVSGTPVFDGGGNLTGYGGTSQIFDAVTNVSPAPDGTKMQWDVRANIYYEIKVRAIDKSGNASSYTALTSSTVIQSAKDTTPPASPTSVSATSAIKSVFLSWTNPTDADLAYINIYRTQTDTSTVPSAPTIGVTTPYAKIMSNSYVDSNTIQGKYYHYWLTSVDDSGNETATTSTVVTIQPGLVANTDITTFAVDATKMFTNTVILKADIWSDNSPSAGYIAWNDHTLVYGGASYSISAGSTNQQFVYWTGGTTYSTSDTNPTLTDGQFMIATNAKDANGNPTGLHDLAWNAIANAVIGSAYIQNAAITNAKVNDLAVDKLTSGSISAQTISLIGNSVIKSSSATSSTSGSGLWIKGLAGGGSEFAIGDLAGTNYGYLRWLTSSNSLEVKGDVKAVSGYFGTSNTNGVKIDSSGLEIIGSGASDNVGRIKANIDWNPSGGTSGRFESLSTSGFFLGRASNKYRFFIGNTGTDGLGGSGNYFYWDGNNLKVNGAFFDPTTGNNIYTEVVNTNFTATSASNAAAAAQISASGAQATANGRNKVYYQAETPTSSTFQGTISGTTLTVNAPGVTNSASGGVPIRVGSTLSGTGVAAGTVVIAFVSGTNGGAGTYTISPSQTVSPAVTITADPVFLDGDVWYDTDANYKTSRYSNGSWVNAFAPLFTFDGNNKISGFLRVSDITGTTASDEFAVVADKFQIWNGSSDEVPFTVDTSSGTFSFNGTIAQNTAVLTINSVTSGTLKLGMTLAGSGIIPNTIIRTLLSGTLGQAGSTYLISNNHNNGVGAITGSMTASYAGQVRITDALIQTLDAGKITSGFLSSQVIELPNSSSYIQSSNFIETHVPGKQYITYNSRTQPSDQSFVKVQQLDGTYKIYRCVQTTTTTPPNGIYWEEVTNTTTLQGFRIVGNGQADFQNCSVVGTIIASSGYFGSANSAVQIDSAGMITGASGRIQSNGLTWSSGSADPTAGSGFFLGYRGTAHQFFVGSYNGHNLRWNGSALSVNGQITASSGQIGGFTIASSSIYSLKSTLDSASAGVFIGTTGIALGANSLFKVTNAGVLTAESGTVGGWSISSTSFTAGSSTSSVGLEANATIGGVSIYAGNSSKDLAPFRVTNTGVLTATSATITGSITATSGTIGGFTIGASSIYSGGKSAWDTVGAGVYVGTDGIAVGPNSTGFKVSNTGILTASSATITGSITATSGTIGAWTINSTSLQTTSTAFIQAGTDSNNYVKISNSGIVGYQGGAEIFKIPTTGSPIFKNGVISTTTINIDTSVLRTSANVGDGSAIGFGVLIDSSGVRGFKASDVNPVFLLSASNGNITAKGGTVGGWTLSSTTLTGGNVTIDSGGNVRGGKATYADTAAGFWLGIDGGDGKFNVGNATRYLKWTGSELSVSGNIVGGTTVGSSGDTVGLKVASSYGMRRSVNNSVLTITGGDGNGIYYGAQIDLVGSDYENTAADSGTGTLQLSAGYRISTNYNTSGYDGSIVFRTSKENNGTGGNDNNSGAQRFRIEPDGTVRVVHTASGLGVGQVASGYPNNNVARFIVEASTDENQVEINDGKVWFGSTDNNTRDTNLYRAGPDKLATDDDIFIGVATTRYLYFYNAGSQIQWGDGAGVYDTNLFRSAANTLQTDDNFVALSVTTTSSKRTKKNIKLYKSGLDIVKKLKPVSFTRKIDNKNDIGFVAEDVDKVLSMIVAKNEKGQVEGLDYSKLTVVLVNAVKELSAKVNELELKLNANANKF